MDQKKKLSPAITALVVIVLVGIVASVAIVINKNGGVASLASNSTSSSVVAPTSTDTSTYKDGTYDATASYFSPGGRESIQLTVTIKGGIIQDTTVVNQSSDSEAHQHQALFLSSYKSLVVGKKINDIGSLSRVAGSSLTSNGFNDALDQIKATAKA
ncbi:MAG: hypothetical protein ACOH18_01020 [Candidatus Saccharimonadaceae bacterium]